MKVMQLRFMYLLFLPLLCPEKQDIKLVDEILIVTPVRWDIVPYEENEDVVFNGQKYMVRYKVSYQNGELISFRRFMPEGPLDYTLEELKADTAIYISLNIPIKQKWQILGDTLFDNANDIKIPLSKLNDNYYKDETDRRIFRAQ
ncbi:MAG: hypothetical protein IPI60_18785 [Saprospiraceae bacterium]|nr:hypothetical protein [Saprospiraceae bacterium]